MKKIILLSTILIGQFFYAQETEVKTDSVWVMKGTIAVLGSQSSFSQWQAGGSNNLAINGAINYDINYKKADWIWDNKLIASYGINKLN